MRFDGFISYSHAADGRLAPAVQRGLHRLARRWYQRRALWIFRDQTGLAVTPGLWSSIQAALDGSRYFVLLASPEAAYSPWVNKEIEHWVATKSPRHILPVVTGGQWRWDPAAGDFSADSTAVPVALRGVFTEEPLYLDLRWARDEIQLNLQHARFRDAVAQLAAPMHGISKDDLEGEDVRQHRRSRRFRMAATATLVVLTLTASLSGILAARNADRANAAAAEAQHQQRVASEQRGSAERATQESLRQRRQARTQEQRAREAAAQTRRQKQLARRQQGLAERATGEATRQRNSARRQQQLARRATVLAREQEAVAREQAQWAARATRETQRQRQIAQQQQRLAAQATADARRQRDNARRQQRLAEQATAEANRQERAAREQQGRAERAAAEADRQERAGREQQARAERAAAEADRQQQIATGRRLINQARDAIDSDPATALRLGVAAQRIQPGPEARSEVAGLVTSTHYAGALSAVSEVAYGSTGILATVDTGPTVSMWDVADRANPVRLSSIEVNRAMDRPVLRPDGRLLAILEEGPNLNYQPAFFDVTDPTRPVRIGTLPGEPDLYDMTFSPDGRTLATMNWSSDWSLWDVADPRRPRLLTTRQGYILPREGLAFASDSRVVVMATKDAAAIWDVTDRTAPVTVGMLPGSWVSLDASPTRSVLATRDKEGLLTLWDLSEEQPQQTARLSGQGSILEFNADGTVLASGDGETATVLWDVKTLTQPQQLKSLADIGTTYWLAFAPDGRTLATAGAFWDVEGHGSPKLLSEVGGPSRGLTAALLDPDGRSLTLVERSGGAVVWDVTAPDKPVQSARLSVHSGEAATAALSPDGDIIAAGIRDRVTLTDISDVTRPRQLAVLPHPPWVTQLAFSPDGRTLAAATWSGVVLWDLADRSRITTLANENPVIAAVAWSGDSRTLAVTEGSTMVLWDMTDRSGPVRVGSAMQGSFVSSATFSPDGGTLATGDPYGRATLWAVADRTRPRKLAVLPDHRAPVKALAFSPDGRILAVGSGQGKVSLWDLDKPTRPTRLVTRTDPKLLTRSLTWHPDGHTLLAADGNATLWSLERLHTLRADPVRHACAIAARGLTADEWEAYLSDLPYQATCARPEGPPS